MIEADRHNSVLTDQYHHHTNVIIRIILATSEYTRYVCRVLFVASMLLALV